MPSQVHNHKQRTKDYLAKNNLSIHGTGNRIEVFLRDKIIVYKKLWFFPFAMDNLRMKKVDPEFFKPFIQGTIRTLKVQCDVDIISTKPYFKGSETASDSIKADISGIVGLTSKIFSGNIAISFPKSAFLLIMNEMMGENFTEIDKDLEDGAAELLNIIFGQAKITLNDELGYEVDMAIPTVITGSNIKTSSILGRTIVLPFHFEKSDDKFCIEIVIDEREK